MVSAIAVARGFPMGNSSVPDHSTFFPCNRVFVCMEGQTRRIVVVGHDLWSLVAAALILGGFMYATTRSYSFPLLVLSQGEATCRIPYHSMSFRLRESKEPAVVMPGMWCPAY